MLAQHLHILTLFVVHILFSIAVSITAVVFVFIISQPGELLGFWQKLLYKLPEFIGKPLGLCEKCFTGQLALFTYLYLFIRGVVPYDPLAHIVFISFSILVTNQLTRILKFSSPPPNQRKSTIQLPELCN